MTAPTRIIAALALLVLAACQDKPAVTDPGDTPQAALSRAETAAAKGNTALARSEYEAALSLDQRFLPAYQGLADLALTSDQWEMGLKAVEEARTWLSTPQQHFQFTALQMRLLTDRAEPGFEQEAFDLMSRERRRDDAAREDPDLNLRLGEAYLTALKAHQASGALGQAETYLDRAVRLGGEQGAHAAGLLAEVRKIRDSALGNSTAGRLAERASLNRVDIVALLDSELDLATLIPSYIGAAARKGETAENGDSDYAGLDLAAAIRSLHRQKLRTLSIENGAFRPRDVMTREAFALLLEDLIIRITGDKKLATAHFGRNSPFTDLPGTRPSFNAVMNIVGRGYLSAGVDGSFRPTAPISGADAIAALRRLATLKPAG